jgi:hypothetical protein
MPPVRDARDLVEQQLRAANITERSSAYACTVVNIMPYAIHEEKPHMLPSSFDIPAADAFGEVAILWVEEGIHYIPDPFDSKSFRQTTPPREMARSVVEDYNTAHIALDENSKPGLFWVEGRFEAFEIIGKFPKQYEAAKKACLNWFRNLVSMADVDWEKNKNRLAVSDLQRMAARSLGLNRDWVDIAQFETIRCPFCTTAVSPDAIKCPNCHEIINKEMYRKMRQEMEDNNVGQRDGSGIGSNSAHTSGTNQGNTREAGSVELGLK